MSISPDARRPAMRRPCAGWLPRALLFAVLILWAVVQLYPIVWMILSALKTQADFFASPFGLPKAVCWENLQIAWLGHPRMGSVALWENTINTAIVTFSGLALLVAISTMAAYALAKFTFPGRKLLLNFYIAMLAVPVHAVIVSVYRMMVGFKLTNTYIGLILVNVTFGLPFAVIMLQAYFRSFPREIIEAATIDGASNLTTFLRIVFPVSKGAISSVVIVNFIIFWNEFLFAFVLNTKLKTLMVAVLGYRGQYAVNWTVLMAGLTIAALPSLLFYFVFQKNIVQGMTMGAVKG